MTRSITLTADLADGGTVTVVVKCDPTNLTDAEKTLIRAILDRFMNAPTVEARTSAYYED